MYSPLLQNSLFVPEANCAHVAPTSFHVSIIEETPELAKSKTPTLIEKIQHGCLAFWGAETSQLPLDASYYWVEKSFGHNCFFSLLCQTGLKRPAKA